MQLPKIWTILVITGLHLLVGLFAITFCSSEDPTNLTSVSSSGKVIFLGANKHSAATAVFESVKPAEKYGLFCPSINALAKALPDYSTAIIKGRSIVLLIDMGEDAAVDDDNDLMLLVDRLPTSIPIIWLAVSPIDHRVETKKTNSQITEFNRKIKKLCAAKENCSFIDPTNLLADDNGDLKSNLHTGDGVHFNDAGSQIWVDTLKSVLP